jgi:hypothetical protein
VPVSGQAAPVVAPVKVPVSGQVAPAAVSVLGQAVPAAVPEEAMPGAVVRVETPAARAVMVVERAVATVTVLKAARGLLQVRVLGQMKIAASKTSTSINISIITARPLKVNPNTAPVMGPATMAKDRRTAADMEQGLRSSRRH